MPSVRIVYDVDGWAYHRRALALQRHAPPDIAITLAPPRHITGIDAALGEREPDVVFVLSHADVRPVRRALGARGWRTRLIGSWNCGWPLRIPEFYPLYRDADAVIVNNALAWLRFGQLPRTHLLPNGVDDEVFRVRVPISSRSPRVLWTGSHLGRQRKGYDRLLLPLQRRLRAEGIDCDLLLVNSYAAGNRSAAEMAEWFNSGTVYVCASSTEGTPNPALEAAACGCTVVSTATGNMPELIRNDENGYLVERSVDALLAGVRAACANYRRLAAQMQRDIADWRWTVRSAGFYDLFREVGRAQSGSRRTGIARRPAPSASRAPLDLSERVTVFVSTVGAPSYEACRQHLETQDCTFRLRVIERVAPMSAAFQRMLDDCETPYFVQVDEDMLLYPHAVRTLYERIADAGDDVAIMMGDLYDAHLERCILGVKIYRHAVVRRYPFADAPSFEKLHVQQLKDDGFRIVWSPPGNAPSPDWTLGLHGTHWTTESIYERYATLERRRRGHPRELAWVDDYPTVFLRRFLSEPSELDFFALLGLLSGALPANDAPAAAKDFRTYAAQPGLALAHTLFARLRLPGAASVAVPRRQSA